MPRPRDLVFKVTLLPLGYGIGHLADDATGGVATGAAIAAWLVFELGLYQARYILNDVLDADVDRVHVAAKARGRLPAVPGARRWAIRTAAGLLVASTVVVALLPDPARTITIVAAVGLLAASVAYEGARTLGRRRSASGEQGRLSPHDAAVYSLVGAGSALRIGLGVALAGADGVDVTAAVAFGWAFGVMVVVMTWTLEAAGLRLGDGTAVLARKPHVRKLAQMIDDEPAHLEQPLLGGRPGRLAGGLLAVTSVLAVVVGARLGEAPGSGRLVAILLACVVVGPLLVARWPAPSAGLVAMALDVTATATLAAGGGRAVMVALVLFVSGVVAGLRTFSPASLQLNPPVPAGTAGR